MEDNNLYERTNTILAALAQDEGFTARQFAAMRRVPDVSVEEFWTLPGAELQQHGVPAVLVAQLLQIRSTASLERTTETLRRLQVSYISYYDARFPALLRELALPPAGLFVRGKLSESRLAVAVVGTRKMTDYGKRVTHDVVEALAAQPVVVVSGLALGVDAEAHRCAIECKGMTWAVVGSGVDVPYPALHRRLAEEIIASGGAIISEFPLGSRPQRHHFPIRNRIIAGLSVATVVIEAAERSGSLLTARAAFEANRDVFAVPGSIYSPYAAGPHRLIQLGAKLIHAPDDVLEELGLLLPEQSVGAPQADSAEEAAILHVLSTDGMPFDDLVEQSGLSSDVCMSTLTLMEMKGRAKNIGANTYARLR